MQININFICTVKKRWNVLNMLLGFYYIHQTKHSCQKGLLLTSITTTKEQNHKDYGMEPDVRNRTFFLLPFLQHLNDTFIHSWWFQTSADTWASENCLHFFFVLTINGYWRLIKLGKLEKFSDENLISLHRDACGRLACMYCAYTYC